MYLYLSSKSLGYQSLWHCGLLAVYLAGIYSPLLLLFSTLSSPNSVSTFLVLHSGLILPCLLIFLFVKYYVFVDILLI